MLVFLKCLWRDPETQGQSSGTLDSGPAAGGFRQERSLDRLMDRKLKLLLEMQANYQCNELATQRMENNVRGTKKHVFLKTNLRSH